MLKEGFLEKEVKERVIKGLTNEVMYHITNREEMTKDNQAALNFYQNEEKLNEVITLLIENAKLEITSSGRIAGNKEVLAVVNLGKARDVAVNFYKQNNI